MAGEAEGACSRRQRRTKETSNDSFDYPSLGLRATSRFGLGAGVRETVMVRRKLVNVALVAAALLPFGLISCSDDSPPPGGGGTGGPGNRRNRRNRRCSKRRRKGRRRDDRCFCRFGWRGQDARYRTHAPRWGRSTQRYAARHGQHHVDRRDERQLRGLRKQRHRYAQCDFARGRNAHADRHVRRQGRSERLRRRRLDRKRARHGARGLDGGERSQAPRHDVERICEHGRGQPGRHAHPLFRRRRRSPNERQSLHLEHGWHGPDPARGIGCAQQHELRAGPRLRWKRRRGGGILHRGARARRRNHRRRDLRRG